MMGLVPTARANRYWSTGRWPAGTPASIHAGAYDALCNGLVSRPVSCPTQG